MKNSSLTSDRAKELLQYNESTGWLIWKRARGLAVKGNRAGSESLMKCGYRNRHIWVDGKKYLEHRVVWLIVTGEFPKLEIDHLDHDGTNNRFENLREATRKENGRNRKVNRDNTTGTVGVSWNRFRSRFVACIRVDGRLIHLGSFKSFDAAVECRKSANAAYGFHSNHGK
jgi:hypothetical protein